MVICGFDWFTRFCETKPADELAVVVVVNNVNEFSAGLRAELSSLLIEAFIGDLLLSQIERQIHEMIASGAAFENTVTSRNENNDIVVEVSEYWNWYRC